MTIVAVTYSFVDVQASLIDPLASFDIKSAGVASEGIRVRMLAPKGTMQIGAGGDGMHSLSASQAGQVEITMLKTAPGNRLLNELYKQAKQSSANWGRTQITINNPVTGDNVTCSGGAIEKLPDDVYSAEGAANTWVFNFVAVEMTLGNGFAPSVI